MSKIVSIATTVPEYRHEQQDILAFMQNIYAMDKTDKRKLRYLYNQSAINTRHSVLPDCVFYAALENTTSFADLELRMKWFNETAPQLSISAIEKCIHEYISKDEITHLITVSCTGMSAPGLDLQIIEAMDLPPNIFRTSVNFMGCYAAIHALKLADALCKGNRNAKILIVCTELCTLHFQQKKSIDNIASSLLFADGCAAVLVTNDDDKSDGLHIKNFYSEVSFKGKKDMSWQLSSSGFLMTLSAYIPDLLGENFNELVQNALQNASTDKQDISHWCIHPGGKKILSSIQKSIDIPEEALCYSYNVLKDYGNMSSPTILFVLKKISDELKIKKDKKTNIFGAAFGPGLTMETFILSDD